MTITDEQTKPDVLLLGRRDEPAIAELVGRVHRRQAVKPHRRQAVKPPMTPLVIARPAQWEKASEPMLAALCAEGVPGALAEAERRRLAGEQTS